MTAKRFKVALSFPGERRDYVAQIADILAKELGGQDKVFYDQWHTAELAQVDLDVLLQSIYHDHAELIVPFLCSDYEKKEWCGLEWRAIKDLIKQRQRKEIMPMRFDDTPIPGFYGTDGYVDLNNHTPQETANLILQRLHLNTGEQPTNISELQAKTNIHIDRLPTVSGGFFGRQEELALLDNALANNEPRIIQFIAAGGTGKTKLLRHWLNQHDVDIPNRIIWSFYSQGSAEDKQVSASPFFSDAFKVLRADKTEFSSEEEKGDYLAELLIRYNCLLVLDGLEPLQHVGKGMDGRLKDRAITRLLQKLAAQHTSLCIITTRIRVHDISDRPHVHSVELDNLQPADGVALLQSLGVKGTAAELDKAVREYGCHALALHLLGNALTTYLDGDIHKRDTLDELLDEYADSGRHAFKVMQAYQQWLQGTPELQLLYLLGLFDHPIEQDVLFVLLQEESLQAFKARLQRGIAYKTKEMGWFKRVKTHFKLAIQAMNANTEFSKIMAPLKSLDKKQLQQSLLNLRKKHRLLSTHEGCPELLDCHPLIREYFGSQLHIQQPKGWQLGHERLYEYYKNLPEKKPPDNLEDMRTLFSAITHGCSAGLHQQVLEEIYWPLIQRDNEHYITHKLGAFSDDLAVLANYFTVPWNILETNLREPSKANLLGRAGFDLHAVGRLHEALTPIQVGLRLRVQQQDWANAAISSGNFCELQLSLGNIVDALQSGQYGMDYADQSGDWTLSLGRRVSHARALHQAGKILAANTLFQEAEQIQQEQQPKYPYLYSVRGFHYCDLLLTHGETPEALVRAEYDLNCWTSHFQNGGLLEFSLPKLTIGRAYFQQENFLDSICWLDQAVVDLRAAGTQYYFLYGLLARTALHRATGDFARARQDLQEVFDIAEPSGMRLHLTDYHLEMARLLLAEAGFDSAQSSDSPPNNDSGAPRCLSGVEGNIEQAQTHVAAAAKLIEETGYHRRDKELAELQAQLYHS